MTVALDLTVRHNNQGYQADLRVHIAGSTTPVAPLPAPAAAAFDLARLRALSLDPRAYGAALMTMLFASARLRAAFAQARAVAAQHATPLCLRLTLSHDVEELHALRWETLADPEVPDQALATSTRLLFSRTLPSPDWQPVPVRTGGALRAIALVAAPADLPDYGLATLDTTQKIAQARAQLSGCMLTVLGQELRASLPNLLQQLHCGCDLLFMLAHGRADEQGQTWLYLEDDTGQTAPIAGAELVARIGALADKPHLIILGSCESAGDGSSLTLAALGPQLVRAGVPAVLAMQGRITLETLGRFLPACLQALATDGRIDRAVAIARNQVHERPDWWVPALWMRATDGRLWLEPTRPSAPPNAALHQLRPPIADFVGRQEEIARLTSVLRRAQTEEGRVAAICGVRGMGGIGKTSLAEVVAHQLRPLFPDAQLVIDLRGATPEPLAPALALQQLVRAFVPEEKLPEDLPTLQVRYRSLLDSRRVLILADDARDAAQVRPLLPPAGCALLITSRQRFALDGMASLDLTRLNNAEAIQLLQGICPRLSDDQAKRLAHLCGGLPLALRVSAGILLNDEALPVERYLTQLADERKRLIQLRDPDDPERDVAATLHLSYAALDLPTQEAFRRLGVLAADADLSLIAAVLEQSEEEIEAVLRLLLRRSMVEYDATHERWGMHDLVRVFALERLAKAGEEQAAWIRYGEQVRFITAQADCSYHQGGQGILKGLAQFDQTYRHLDAVRAWLWAQHPEPTISALIWDIALATQHLSELRDPVQSVRIPQWECALMIAKQRADRQGEGRALGQLGIAYLTMGEVRTAITYCDQHLAIAQETQDRLSESVALSHLGSVYRLIGEVPAAIAYFEQHLALTQEMRDRRGEGQALSNLGIAYFIAGKIRSAIIYCEQHLSLARELGDWHGESLALGYLGNIFWKLGEVHTAITYCEQHLAIAREIGDRRGEGRALGNLSNAYLAGGMYEQAYITGEAALAIFESIGDARLEGYTYTILGHAAAMQGEQYRASALLTRSLMLVRAAADRVAEAITLRYLADLAVQNHDFVEANTNYALSLAILDDVGHRIEISRTRWAYGQLLVRQGERERGLALMQACVEYEQQISHTQATEHAMLVTHLQASDTLSELMSHSHPWTTPLLNSTSTHSAEASPRPPDSPHPRTLGWPARPRRTHRRAQRH